MVLCEISECRVIQLAMPIDLVNLAVGACEVAGASCLPNDLVCNARKRTLDFILVLRCCGRQQPGADRIGCARQQSLKQWQWYVDPQTELFCKTFIGFELSHKRGKTGL